MAWDWGTDPQDYEALAAELREAAASIGDRPSSEDLRPVLAQAAGAISRHREAIRDPVHSAIADAATTLLVASAAAMQAIGVCRVQEPFADLYEVIDPDGHGGYVRRLCCTHQPQHCVTG